MLSPTLECRNDTFLVNMLEMPTTCFLLTDQSYRRAGRADDADDTMRCSVSRQCSVFGRVVGSCRESLLCWGRIRASRPSSSPLRPDAASERLRERTSQMAPPPELRALSPPHPSEDRLRRKTPPRPFQLPRDEDRPRGAREDTVHKYLESPRQVAF